MAGFHVYRREAPAWRRALGLPGRWAYRSLVAVDQLANAVLLFGDPDETISSRLGKLKLRHGGAIPWSRPLAKLVDAGLDLLDAEHSLEAIEPDEGKPAHCSCGALYPDHDPSCPLYVSARGLE